MVRRLPPHPKCHNPSDNGKIINDNINNINDFDVIRNTDVKILDFHDNIHDNDINDSALRLLIDNRVMGNESHNRI